MARVSTYLNFMGNAEEAMERYREIFSGRYLMPAIRMSDGPAGPDSPPLSDAEKNMVMHVELEIMAGHVLMATDMIESMGHELRIGNNTTINLEFDSREETDRVYAALAEGASDATDVSDMPWGTYWGVCLDRFGIRWMFNGPPQP